MKCLDIHELASFVAGSLSDDRQEPVSIYLAECDSCMRALERLRVERELEAQLREPLAQP